MSQPLYLRTANDMKGRVKAGLFADTPSAGELARTWRVSERTMRRALGVLAREGILDCARGRRARLAGPSAPGRSAADRFFDSLRERIVKGAYQAGRALPKVNYFVVQDRVSPNTVAAACARLGAEGLAHRSGKQWIVGKAPAGTTLPRADSPWRRSTAVFLFRLGEEWNPFFTHTWISRFSAPLSAELELYGWMTSLAFMDRRDDAAESTELSIPAGTDQIVEYARRLGERYRGTFLYYGVRAPADTYSCIRAVLGLGMPVVYFDHNDGHPELAGEFSSRRRNLFFRCHLDETGAIRLALRTLADLGHRRIGVPMYQSDLFDWVPRRVERIKQAAACMSPPLEILAADMRETFWRIDERFDLSRYADHVRAAVRQGRGRAGEVSSASFASLVRTQTPSLDGLLGRGATAILCLNDQIAREVFLWTRYAGLRVPQDLTLLSFDNSVDCRSFPVSTIDFGFARLGYLAAHLLIGDIPVKADATGNVPGICEIVHRGSLGSPRKDGRPD